jgi:carbonic anhydrase
MVDADAALERLKAGNRRFVTEGTSPGADTNRARRRTLVEGQNPFAVVLGCSDSRGPAELVFDQGLGDLFVIRVAGNIAEPSQIGSVEYAAQVLGTRLVVVMGHRECGAVTAALAEIASPGERASPNLQVILDRIRPAAEPLFSEDLAADPAALLDAAVRANVRATVAKLGRGSEVLRRLMERDGLRIVGSVYDLATGVVEFLDRASRAP